jgi:glycosyltransferase involved in cell wall biosynthesis
VWNISGGAQVLTYIAEYTPWKDHRTLLLAFKRLATKREDLYLFLCGDLRSIETDLINPILGKDKLKHRVILLGPQRDVYAVLSNTDIYVHPCYLEGFGNSVLEAMMAGVPVVAANGGALPEVVGDTAVLFSPKDPESLARAIETLLIDTSLGVRLAKEAKGRAMQQFSSSAFAKRFLRTTQDILKDLGHSSVEMAEGIDER